MVSLFRLGEQLAQVHDWLYVGNRERDGGVPIIVLEAEHDDAKSLLTSIKLDKKLSLRVMIIEVHDIYEMLLVDAADYFVPSDAKCLIR